MTAVTAIKTDLRREILRILREDIVYLVQGDDGGGVIEPTAILYQKTRLQKQREFEQSNQTLDVPGLVVSEPFRTFIDPNEGTNERDLWHYRWLVQLVDNDLWQDEARISTWERWNEQIVSKFLFSCLNDAVVLPKGQVMCSTATGVMDIDENSWIRDSQFISGVEIEVRCLQSRG